MNVGEARGAFSVSSSLMAAWTVVAAIFPAGVFGVVVAVWSPVFVQLVLPTTVDWADVKWYLSVLFPH